MPSYAIGAATGIATATLMESANASENTNWAIRIEICKSNPTTLTSCLLQVQEDKVKRDHQDNVDSLQVFLFLIAFIVGFCICVAVFDRL
jgi:hypothetical protein